MKFNGWKLNDLIDYLNLCKSSTLLDCHCETRCFGEIHLYNGERKDGLSDEEIFPGELTNNEN